MPKAKIVHRSFRLTPGKSKLSLNFVIALGVLTLLLVSSLVYFSPLMQQTPSINETTTTFYPLPVTRDCEIVNTFSLSGNCGSTSYQTATFKCGKKGNMRRSDTTSKSCKDYITLYKDAQATCLSACPTQSLAPYPSSSPIIIPQPSSSPITIPMESPTSFPPRSPLPYQTP